MILTKSLESSPLARIGLLGVALGACALTGARSAESAPLDPHVVAADAAWYVHVDVDAARNSPVARKLHEQMLTHEGAKRHLRHMQEMFHFNPTRDLHSITRYGSKFEPHSGVLVLKADVDQSFVLGKLKEKRSFKSTAHGDHELLSWAIGHSHHGHGHGHRHHDARHDDWRNNSRHRGEGRHADSRDGERRGDGRGRDGDKRSKADRITISFVKDGLVIVGHSEEAVKAGLDVVDAKSSSLSPQAVDTANGAMLQVLATGLSDAKLPFKVRSPLLAQTDRMSLSLSDADGKLNAHLILGAKSAEVASQVEAVVAGFRALAQLRHSKDEDVKGLLENLKTSTKDSAVDITWAVSDEQALKMHDKIHAMRKHSRERSDDRDRRSGNGGRDDRRRGDRQRGAPSEEKKQDGKSPDKES
jgi:hypothetical protein